MVKLGKKAVSGIIFFWLVFLASGQSRVPGQVGNWLQVAGITNAGTKDTVNVTFFEVSDTVTGTIYFAINNPRSYQGGAGPDEGTTAGITTIYLVGGEGCLSQAESRWLWYTATDITNGLHKIGSNQIQTITITDNTDVNYDGWVYFNGVVKEQGEKIGNKYYFKVVMTVDSTVIKNAYQLDASYQNTPGSTPTGITDIRAFGYSWSIGLDDDNEVFYMYPFVPENDTGYIVFSNFDFDVASGTSPSGAAYARSQAQGAGATSTPPPYISDTNDVLNTSYALTAGETNGTWKAEYNEGPANGFIINTAEVWFWNSASAQNNNNTMPPTNSALYRIYADYYAPPPADHVYTTYTDGVADAGDGSLPAHLEQISFQVVGSDDTPLPYRKNLYVTVSGSALIRETNSATGLSVNNVIVTTGSDGIGWVKVSDLTAQSVTVSVETDGPGQGSSGSDSLLPGANNSVVILYQTAGGAPPVVSSASTTTFTEGNTQVLPVVTLTEDAAVVHCTAANDVHIKIPDGLNAVFNSSITPTFGGTASGRVNGGTPVTYLSGNKIVRINLDTDFTLSQTLTVTGLAFTNVNSVSVGYLELSYSGLGGPYNVIDDKKITINGYTTYIWNGSGSANWSASGNWTTAAPAGGPDAGNVNATIQNVSPQPAPVLDGGVTDPVDLFNFSIAGSASLNAGTHSLHVYGTFSNSGTLYLNGTAGTLTLDQGMDTNSGTVEYQGTGGSLAFPGYYNLRLNGSGTWTAPAGTLNIYGNLTIENGNTLDLSTNSTTLHVYGSVSLNGTGAVNTGSGTVTYEGPVSLGTGITSNNTDITFNSAVTLTSSITISTGAGGGGNINLNQGISGSGTQDLTLQSGTGNITIGGALSNLNNVTIQGNNLTAAQMTAVGSITIRTDDITLNNNISAGGDLNFYTRTGAATMGVGGAAGTWQLDDTEISRITGVTGTIRFGEDGVQTGAIGMQTVNLSGLNRPLVISTSGTITLDEDNGGVPGTALNNGSGAITFNADGALAATAAHTAGGYQPEIATTGLVTILSTTGDVGSDTNRVQFMAGQDEVVVTSTAGNLYLDGVNGLTLQSVTTGGGNLTVSTRAGNIVLNNNVINAGAGTVILEAGGAVNGAANDATAEVSAATVTLRAHSGGIGTGTPPDIAVTTALNADTGSWDSSNILIDTIGGSPVGYLNAGTGNITLNSTSSITDTNAAAVNVRAGQFTVTSASGTDLDTDITTLVNAAISGTGNIDIQELDTVSADGLTVTSFNATAGTGGDVVLYAVTGNLTVNGWNLDNTDNKALSLRADAGNVTYPNANINIGTGAGAVLTFYASGDVIRTGGGNHNVTAYTLNVTSGSSENFTTSIDNLTAVINGAGNSLTVSEASALTVTSVATSNGNVTLSTGGAANIAVDSITAGTATVSLTAAGSIEESGADAPAEIVAATIDLNAATGIGAAAQLEITGQTLTLDSGGNGNIDVDNLATAAAVVNTLTISGTGTITFDQSGNYPLTLAAVSTNNGNVTVTNTGAAADIAVASITAGTATVSLTAGGSIEESGADAPADIVAATIDLNAATGIGAAAQLEITGQTLTLDSSGNGNIDVDNLATAAAAVNTLTISGTGTITFDQSGNYPLTLAVVSTNNGNVTVTNTGAAASIAVASITAGTASVSLTAGGSIEESGADAPADIVAATIDLNAATGIGAAGQLEITGQILTLDSGGNGNIDVDNLATAAAALNTITIGGTGAITFDQSGNYLLSLATATTNNGSITITVTGADLDNSGGTVTAGGGNSVTLSALTGAGCDVFTGTVNAAGGTITINAVATINDDGAGSPDITCAAVDLNAGTGIGNTNVIRLSGVTGINADTTDPATGNINISNAATAAVTVNSLTSAGAGTVAYTQTGNQGALLTAVSNTNGNITLSNSGGAAAGFSIGQVTADTTNDTVQVTASGAVTDNATDTVYDIQAYVIQLTASAGGIGTLASDLDVNAVNRLDADTSADNGNIYLRDTNGDLPPGTITTGSAAAGNIMLTAAGSILQPSVTQLTAGSITLDAAGGIGTGVAHVTTSTANLEARAGGDIYVDEADDVNITGTNLATGLETTAANGSVRIESLAGTLTFLENVQVNGNGAITVAGPVLLGTDVTFNAASGNGAVSFNNTINCTGGNHYSLTVNAGTGNVVIDNGTRSAVIGGSGAGEYLSGVTLTGADITLNGIGYAGGNGVDGAAAYPVTVAATGTLYLYGQYYNCADGQSFAGTAGGARVLLTGNGEFRAGAAGVVFGDVYLYFTGFTLVLNCDINARNFIFYNGTLNVQNYTIRTNQGGGGDFALFGAAYNADDQDTAAGDTDLDYPGRTALSYVVAPAGFGAVLNGNGCTVAVGTGGTGNFYANGVNLNSLGSWNLSLQDNTNANPFTSPPWGIPFAAALNLTVANCTAGGSSVAAAANWTDPGTLISYINQNVVDGLGNTNWDFSAPFISTAYTSSDHEIVVNFSESLGNYQFRVVNDIDIDIDNNLVNDITTNNNNVIVGHTTPLEINSCTAAAANSFRLAITPDTWNTDANGTSAGDVTGTSSTNQSGTTSYNIPNFAFTRSLFYDNSRNRLVNYGLGNSTLYDATTDQCRPVLAHVYASRDAHDAPAEEWDGHNYFRLLYSEPVTVSNLDLSGVLTNQRSTVSVNGASAGGYIDDTSGNVVVTGFFQYNSAVLTISSRYGAAAADKSVNAFRTTGEGQELYLYAAGYKDGGQVYLWPGYIVSAQNPFNAAIIVLPNSNIQDLQSNVLDDSLGASVIENDPSNALTWDVDPPQVAPYPDSAGPGYEIVTDDVNSNSIVDRIEFHILDNSADAAVWTAGSHPDAAGSVSGVRDATFTNLNAFTLSRRSGPVQALPGPVFITTVNNSLFQGSPPTLVNRNDDPYIAISFNEANGFTELDELQVTYDTYAGLITDLAGNLLIGTGITYTCLETKPPEISYSLAAVGGHKVYIKFSEPVFGTGADNALQAADLTVNSQAVVNMDVISRETVGNREGTKEIYLVTDSSMPVTADNSFTWLIQPATGSSVHDMAGNNMPVTYSHPVTDIGLGVVVPAWAADTLHQENTYGPGFTALTDFDGTGKLMDNDITLQVSIQAGSYTGYPATLYYDVDPDSAILKNGFWIPEALPEFGAAVNKQARILQPSAIQNALRTYIIPGSDPEITAGKELQFLVKLGNLYCARLEDENDPLTLAPWKIQIADIQRQAGGVTILNNVINPANNEKTVITYQLARAGMVNVTVFGLDGDIITVLHRGRQGKGEYTFTWDGRNRGGRNVARGVYFIKVLGPGIEEIRKVLVVK